MTQRDIEAGLREVGLRAGDVLLAHSSLSSFGFVEGGADTVVDAMLAAVGEAGTVVVPTFTFGRSYDRQEVVFDLKETPSETGAVCEALRRRPKAMRSEHISHSVAAIGPQAEAVMGDGESAWAACSTLEVLHELDAWNLFLGVGFHCCTAFHAAEEQMQVTYRAYRDYVDSVVVLPDGTRKRSRALDYLRKEGYRNDFTRAAAVLAEWGVLWTTTVGKATITNARICQVIDIAKECLARDSGFLLAQ